MQNKAVKEEQKNKKDIRYRKQRMEWQVQSTVSMTLNPLNG